jgi:hypothetical protein
LPGGGRGTGGLFYDLGSWGFWWSATEYDAADAYLRGMGTGGSREKKICVAVGDVVYL